MTSKIEICNLALLQIGGRPITNLNEKSKAAYLCNRLYAPSRDAVLESFPWSFALQRQTLALLAEPAPDPWSHAYQKPVDCLRAEEIIPTRPDTPVLFAVEGNKILTEQAGAVLLYVRSIDDPTLFSAQFVQALLWYLAGKLAIPLTGDEAKTKLCLQMYGAVTQEARTIQANQGRPRSKPLPPWIAARSGR